MKSVKVDEGTGCTHFGSVKIGNHADNGEPVNMVAGLAGIQRNIDKADRTDRRVQNLATYINVNTLEAAHKKMDGKKAVGVDRVTKDEYSKNLEQNLESLVDHMKRGEYRPQPSKRVYIPKDGKGKFRPLGISPDTVQLPAYRPSPQAILHGRYALPFADG